MPTAKVAHVLSEHEVVFNAGSERGVKRGDIVKLYREIEVVDPDTEEPLGKVRRPLISLRVAQVEKKFCVGATYEREQNVRGISAMALSLGSPPSRWKVTTDRSKVD